MDGCIKERGHECQYGCGLRLNGVGWWGNVGGVEDDAGAFEGESGGNRG